MDDKIKESFEQQPPKKAPKLLWDTIANELNQEPSSETDVVCTKIKESFEQQPSKIVPNRVWQAIEKQLNIDAVWSKIQTTLQQNQLQKQQKYRQQYKSIARWTSVAACLLIFWRSCLWIPSENETVSRFTSNFQESAITSNEPIVNSNEPIINSNEPIVNSNEPIVNSNEPIINSNEPIVNSNEPIVNSNEPIVNSNEPIINSNEPIANSNEPIINSNEPIINSNEPIINSNEPIINSLAVLEAHSVSLLNNEKVNMELTILPVDAPIKSTKTTWRPHFEVGTLVNTHTSLLLNTETSKSFSPTSLISTNLCANTDLALSLMYKLSKQHALQVDFYPTMHLTQAYERYSKEGKLVKNKLDFRYYQLDVLYQITLLQYHTKQNIKGQLVAKVGSNISHLSQWSEQKYGQTTKHKAQDLYETWNIGAKLALGQRNQWKKFVLDYGIYTELGLKNIFKGDASIPAEALKTKTLNIGAYLALRYAF